ncbi:MAG: hypothetical protein NVS3B16_23780 [Vulcanimicrobiaceae bacterium]
MPGFAKVFEGFSGKLGERWLENLLTPALLFWAGGALVWAAGPDATWQRWEALKMFVLTLDGSHQLLLAAIVLLGVSLSSAIAERFTLPLLRAFEGYWPPALDSLSDRLAARWVARREALETEWNALAPRAATNALSRRELARNAELETSLREIPAMPAYHMPTRIGNILRASERRPFEKYGLDTVVCWPRLWLAMADGVKTEISDARARLNASARLTFWALLFVVWGVSSWIALPIAALVAYYGYRSMIDDASTYGLLVEAAYDAQRRALYKAVGWPYPANAFAEHASGVSLTAYLQRGSDRDTIALRTID